MGHKRALVLNADYTPISITSWQSAVEAQYKDKVTVVDFYQNDKIEGVNKKWLVAAVLACKEYSQHTGRVPFSRKNIFIRDKCTCQYCGEKMHFSKLTFDHVWPRAKHKINGKGKTPTHWKNIVTCCHPCNNKKASYTLEECGMKLINGRRPDQLSPHGYVKGLAPWTILQKEWLPYLPKTYIDICQVDM